MGQAADNIGTPNSANSAAAANSGGKSGLAWTISKVAVIGALN